MKPITETCGCGKPIMYQTMNGWACNKYFRCASPLKMYICVLDEVPGHMVPVLVAHATLGAHLEFSRRFIADETRCGYYVDWISNSFKKCVVKVNRKEFNKIAEIEEVYLAYENTVLDATPSCIVVCPRPEYPNVIKFAKLYS